MEVLELAKKHVDDDDASIVCASLGGSLTVEKCDIWPKQEARKEPGRSFWEERFLPSG